MTCCGLQGEVFVDAVLAVPEHRLPGLVDGGDAVLVDEAVDFLHAVAVPVVGTVVEVVLGRDEVLGVGECRCPLPVRLDGVPSDVVDVQVRVDHDVDVLRTDTGPLQQAEEVTLCVVEGPHTRSYASMARAGVDKDGPAGTAQDPALQSGHHQAAVRFPVVRRQPVRVVLPHIVGGCREEGGGRQERLVPLDDPDDLDVPQHHGLYTLVVVDHAMDLRKARRAPQ